MAAVNTLKMIFEMDDEKSHTISLKNPKTGLTKAQVDTFANLVVTKEAISKNHAVPTRLKDSYIQKSERIELSA